MGALGLFRGALGLLRGNPMGDAYVGILLNFPSEPGGAGTERAETPTWGNPEGDPPHGRAPRSSEINPGWQTTARMDRGEVRGPIFIGC